MVVANLRPAQVLIDQQAIYDNVHAEVQRLHPGTDLFAVVKANAYGHGMIHVAKVAQKAGAKGFCVALLDEALALRTAHFTEPILVLGITPAQLAPIAASQHISLTVGSKAWLMEAKAALDKQEVNYPLTIHLGIDSGMGRIGFTDVAAFLAAVSYMNENKSDFIFEGMFTHFATADDPKTDYFKKQVTQFNQYVQALPQKPRYIHVSNSATSLWHDACNGNMVRFGVAIYGLNPSGRAIEATPYHLKPALSLTSELVFTKQIHAGDSVSYGATYTATQDEWVGTIPLGYADGWLRRLQGFHVLVDGQFCEIIGRICMDQFMIRLPKFYPVGTPVTLIGKDHSQQITLQDVADYSNTIHYELACILTQRLPRKYLPLT